MALTTLTQVKNQAGISLSDTSMDEQIKAFISGITDYVKRYLGRDIESKSYTEYYSGDGSIELILRQFPVISIQRVCEDSGSYFGNAPNAFPASSDLTNGVDYTVEAGQFGQGTTGILRRIGATWQRYRSRSLGTVQDLPAIQQGNILVQYTAGYSPVPPALVMAINSLVIKGVNEAALGGPVASETYEDAAVSYFASSDMSKVLGSVNSTLGLFKGIVL